MFESCAGSFSIHPPGFVSYNCKNDSLRHQLNCLVFADSTVPWLSLCITRISHSCSIFKRTGMKNVTEKHIWGVELWEVGSLFWPIWLVWGLHHLRLHYTVKSLTAGHFHSSPTHPHNCDPINPPPPHSYRGSWWVFLRELTRETTERRAEGRHCSLTGSCGVLDWKHSLILPITPGHSCFKCSQTKQTKMAQLLQGRMANVHRQKVRLWWKSSS